MRVCATSRWVSRGRRGRRVVKVWQGKMVHSWNPSLWTDNSAGNFVAEESRSSTQASLNLVLEQAQKSTAFNFGSSPNRDSRTFTSISSSICS